MDIHNVDLGALLKKYDQVIYDLEMQVAEAKRKKEIVVQTIDIWEREGIFDVCVARRGPNMPANELS